MEVMKTATAKIEEHQRAVVKAENSHRTATVNSEFGSGGQRQRDQLDFEIKQLTNDLSKAGMAELADAADSKSADLRVLGVRLPLPAPLKSLIEPSG